MYNFNPPAFIKSLLIKTIVLITATAIWLPCVHFIFKPKLSYYYSPDQIPQKAHMIAAKHLEIWANESLRNIELEKMQNLNPEWDFMSRTYFVLALANMALRDTAFKVKSCEIIDAIIDNTLAVEKKNGFTHFLMGYGRRGGWVIQPSGSQFIDGEIALMICARRLIEEKPAYIPILSERVDKMIFRMRQSPIQNAESYPDECWLFCNTVSLAAIHIADVLDNNGNSAFIQQWLETAKQKLVNPETGLLISAYSIDGTPADSGYGPEGSTIWMTCNMLQLIDKPFAEDQYKRAHEHLARSFLGFGFSREWPLVIEGTPDVDSGPVIPVLGASASASGLALISAAAFNDTQFLIRLFTSLNFVGFPSESDSGLRYMASNPVGDAVMLYAMVLGPLWDEVERRNNYE